MQKRIFNEYMAVLSTKGYADLQLVCNLYIEVTMACNVVHNHSIHCTYVQLVLTTISIQYNHKGYKM